ncbi:MAG: permease [Burkholderiales bacterium]|nr:MAG: permease [Burkholderiales bacterium]
MSGVRSGLERLATFLGLAARNVARHRLRTGLTLAAIGFGVSGLVLTGGFVQDIYIQLGEAIIRSQTGHVQVARKGFFTYGSQAPEKYLIEDAAGVAQRLAAQPGAAQVMGRLYFSALLGNGRTDLPVVGEGIEPDKEARLGTYMVIQFGERLSSRHRYGILVGEGLARALKLGPGDTVTLMTTAMGGAVNVLDFEVVGVFQSYSKDYDARAVKIPLEAAQELLATSGVNVLVVELGATGATDRFAASLRSRLETAGLTLRTWRELSDFYEKTVDLYERQFGVLRLIVLLMVLLSVANTVNLSLFERIGEFGTMCALGDRRRKVFGLIMTEGLLIGSIGAGIGVALGVGLAAVISAVGIPMPPPPNANLGYMARIQLVPGVITGAALVGVFATVLATLLPARRMARLSIVDALRHNV